MHYILLLLSWPVMAPTHPAYMVDQRPVQAFGSAEFNSQRACSDAIKTLNGNPP